MALLFQPGAKTTFVSQYLGGPLCEPLFLKTEKRFSGNLICICLWHSQAEQKAKDDSGSTANATHDQRNVNNYNEMLALKAKIGHTLSARCSRKPVSPTPPRLPLFPPPHTPHLSPLSFPLSLSWPKCCHVASCTPQDGRAPTSTGELVAAPYHLLPSRLPSVMAPSNSDHTDVKGRQAMPCIRQQLSTSL